MQKKSRIIGYDVARALAIFGMVIVNYKFAMEVGENGPGWLMWSTNLLVGRAAATFVILAGVGISLLSRKGRISQDAERIRQDRLTLLKRGAFLFVLGLLFVPIWPPDILHYYGFYFAIAALLITTSDRKLWLYAVLLLIARGFLILFFDYRTGWDFSARTYLDFWTPVGMLRNIFLNGFHPVIPWLSFMLIGMWLGRQDILDARIRRLILWVSVFAAVSAETLSAVLQRALPGQGGFSVFDTQPMPPMPLYIVAGAGTAIAVITICLELTLRYPQAVVFSALAATGQLALTNYIGHVVLGMGFFKAIGRFENQTLVFAILSAIVYCLLAIIFSYFWRSRYPRGPLEWVMRRMTG